ncbi:MAG: helix-turn-helix domain-containing protein [Clostridia bacterium]|nr:helix-turn-helix domain-containing protein [Clostridia bacterium]
MNIKIGAIIKKLRQENNITQDTLATAIGVTPQAISRWESEGGYPDIELLPPLADFFSVSTDELLGYKLSEREEELANIKKELRRLAEVGTHQEKLSFARDAFVKFPNDFKIKVYLAACLSDEWSNTHEKSLIHESETLCLSVIDDCHDEDIRYEAICTLSSIYNELGEIKKARSTLELLSPMKYCRETALACGIGDGNTELYIQDEIDKFTDGLGLSIHNLALHEDLPDDSSTWNKKIEMLTISNRLYKMIYGDNLMFYHTRLSRNYWLFSTYQIAQGKNAETLESLEKMCYHAIEYDKAYINDHGKYFTSILTDKLIYPEPSKDFHECTEHTECYHILKKMKHPRYDCIRQDSRFISIVEKLNQYSK